MLNRPNGLLSRVLAISLFILLVLPHSSCSRSTIRLSGGSPPKFTLSGNEAVMHFQVSDGSTVLWKLYPKEKDAELNELGTITYGEVPPCCYQAIPKDGPPRGLIESATYTATAVIFDHAPISVRFAGDGRKGSEY